MGFSAWADEKFIMFGWRSTASFFKFLNLRQRDEENVGSTPGNDVKSRQSEPNTETFLSASNCLLNAINGMSSPRFFVGIDSERKP
jgi:hypothetical protein